jgi:sugar lactone lactonase YvrE
MPTRFATLAPLSVLPVRRVSSRGLQGVFTVVSLAGALLVAGCGEGRQLPGISASAAASLHGNVHGGQQPVSGALMQLWAAGNTSNGSAATQLLTSAVYTDGGGGFGITGDYSCPSATSQVYITATGGNPGLAGPANNSALALVAALGDCGSLATVPTIAINELTTVAAAYGLAPFATGISQVGASPANLAGIRSAMLTSMMLASPYSGVAPAPALPTNATTETAKLVTLANIIANCVNSSGGMECSSLAADASVPGLSTPADTFQIALMVAQNPGNHVAALFNDAPAHAAFGGSLATAPNDWSMSIAYTGGGLGRPNSISIDAGGNVWVSNYSGGVSGFSPQGAPMFAGGVKAEMGLSSAATADASGNIWVANGAFDLLHPAGSVARIAANGTVLSGGLGYTLGGINLPDSMAAAPNGTMLVANSGDSRVTVLAADGNVMSGLGGYGGGLLATPSAIAVDAQSNAWVANKGSGTLVKMDPFGNVLLQSACCATPDSVAIDTNSNLWVGDSTAGTVTEVRSDGAVIQVIGGVLPAAPRALAIDGGSHLFIADAFAGGLAERYVSSYAASGAAVGQTPVLGLDAGLKAPAGVAADSSGNVWVTSSVDNRLVDFVGMAVPVSTPHVGLPAQP